jgi:RNAse (barnase) inhibitor barstar
MPSEELWEVAPHFAGWPSVKVLPAGQEPPLRAALQQAGFDVRTLEGGEVTSDSALFEAVARALGLSEDFGANWDALADSLFDLTDVPGRRLALVWRDAHLSLSASVSTVVRALLLLHEQASHAEPDSEPTQLFVYLLGDGPGWA